jgi:hypothetical protein
VLRKAAARKRRRFLPFGIRARGLGASGFCTPSLTLPHIKKWWKEFKNAPRRYFRKRDLDKTQGLRQ